MLRKYVEHVIIYSKFLITTYNFTVHYSYNKCHDVHFNTPVMFRHVGKIIVVVQLYYS